MMPESAGETVERTELDPPLDPRFAATLDPMLAATDQADPDQGDEQTFARGALVGRDVIVERLGAGAMGVVTQLFFLILCLSCGKSPGSSTATNETTEKTTSGGSGSSADTGHATDTGNAADVPTGLVGSTSESATSNDTSPDVPEEGCVPWDDQCPAEQKCLPTLDMGGNISGTRCAPLVRDPASVDQTCEVPSNVLLGDDDCERGTVCWRLDNNHMGHCLAFCDAEFNCQDTFSACFADGSEILRLCLHCDPLADDCASNPSEACQPNPSETGFWCGIFGSGLTGEPCAFQSCAPGHFCAKEGQVDGCEDTRCCAAFCDVTAPLCPNANDVCIPWFEPVAPPPYDKVGRCGPP